MSLSLSIFPIVITNENKRENRSLYLVAGKLISSQNIDNPYV